MGNRQSAKWHRERALVQRGIIEVLERAKTQHYETQALVLRAMIARQGVPLPPLLELLLEESANEILQARALQDDLINQNGRLG